MTTRERQTLVCGIALVGMVLLATSMPHDASAQTREPASDFHMPSIIGHTPNDIWSDGSTIWGADIVNAKIYAYDHTTKARDSTKDINTLYGSGNTSPVGIWSDGTTMWVADVVDVKIYAYNMTDMQRDSTKDFDTLSAAGNDYPRGIWSDGTTMWVSDQEDAKIYAYHMDTKARDSSNDFDTLRTSNNTDPRGIWSDGTTMYVIDRSDGKAYAYDHTTKSHDSTKDIDVFAAAAITYPYGIWSDGSTMWVSDTLQDAIYAYTDLDAAPVIPASNGTPVADAGSDLAAYSGNTITLNGTGSSDPNNDSLTYSWVQMRGPTITLSNSTIADPTFTAPDFDQSTASIAYPDPITMSIDWLSPPWTDMLFLLSVSDGYVSDTDTVVVSMGPAGGVLISDAGPDRIVNASQVTTLYSDIHESVRTGTGVTLDGMQPSSKTTYAWSQLSGSTVTLYSTTSQNPTFTAPDHSTTLVFRLTITDGTLRASDTVTITVQDTDNAIEAETPTVSITHVDGGDGFIPYVSGMTVSTDMPRFRGTSTGHDTVTFMVRASDGTTTQIGTGTAIKDDGSFQRGRTTLSDGTYTIMVGSVSLGTITISTATTAPTTPTTPVTPVTVSAHITEIYNGTAFVPYVDGMTVHTDMPRFRGTSDGYDFIRLQVQDSDGTTTQIGTGTGIHADGSFQRGKTVLSDGTYSIFVNTDPNTILGTFVISTGSQ